MSEHFLGSKKGFEILANLGLDPLIMTPVTVLTVNRKLGTATQVLV
jgi:hypothetical protein